MCEECDFCRRPACSTGELRMVADPDRGGALYPCCLDCWEDFIAARTALDWSALETLDEWAEAATLELLPMIGGLQMERGAVL